MDAGSMLERFGAPSMEDLDEDSDIISWVAAFIAEEDFSDTVQEFLEQNCASFRGFDPEAGEEHKLEFTELYNSFLQISEQKIEKFLASKGFTSMQFKQRCEEVLKEADSNQRNSRTSFFVQLLLACAEYDQFIVMMAKAADPCLEYRQDLRLSAENMLESAKSTPLIDDDRRRIEMAATEALKWLDEHPKCSIVEVENEEETMTAICNPIIRDALERRNRK